MKPVNDMNLEEITREIDEIDGRYATGHVGEEQALALDARRRELANRGNDLSNDNASTRQARRRVF